MSISAEDKTLADNKENVIRPSEERPILSSLNQWRQYSPGTSSQLDEGLEIGDSEDEDSEDESEASESANEGPGSQLPRDRTKNDQDSWLRRNERHKFTNASLKYYQSLLDQLEIDSNIKPHKPSDDQSTISTKIGQIEWTKGEEDRLFVALSRRGKDRIQEIADDIGSKSQSEVLEYVRLLDKAARDGAVQEIQTSEGEEQDGEDVNEQEEEEDDDDDDDDDEDEEEGEEEEEENEEEGQGQKDEHEGEQTPLAMAIPAAIEINEGLDKALGLIARHVSILEQRMDDMEGEKIHGPDFWNIDSNAAEKVEEILASKNNEDSLRSSIFQTASLLNIKQWIRLSERLFMNAGQSQLEDNWRNLAFECETPSLTSDAFNDFYTITRDITKRLMESTLSAAQDRVAKARRKTANVVRKDDVAKGAELLHMKCNPFHFYVHLARRLRLDVAEIFNKKGKQEQNEYLSYEEVENILSQEDGHKVDAKSSKRDQKKHVLEDDGNEDDLQESSIINEVEQNEIDGHTESLRDNIQEVPDSEDEDNITPSQTDDETSILDESQHEVIEPSELARIEYDRKLAEYLDYFDRQSSQQTQADLRALFRANSLHFNLNSEEENTAEASKPPPTMPVMTSPENDTTADWRTELVFRAQWETYKANIRKANEEIASNDRKRRRIE